MQKVREHCSRSPSTESTADKTQKSKLLRSWQILEASSLGSMCWREADVRPFLLPRKSSHSILFSHLFCKNCKQRVNESQAQNYISCKIKIKQNIRILPSGNLQGWEETSIKKRQSLHTASALEEEGSGRMRQTEVSCNSQL